MQTMQCMRRRSFLWFVVNENNEAARPLIILHRKVVKLWIVYTAGTQIVVPYESGVTLSQWCSKAIGFFKQGNWIFTGTVLYMLWTKEETISYHCKTPCWTDLCGATCRHNCTCSLLPTCSDKQFRTKSITFRFELLMEKIIYLPSSGMWRYVS
jgi:hypothetical protein